VSAIRATDASGRWATYVPLTLGGKIVVPRREDVATALIDEGLL